jgi:hypothetical protein
MQDVDIFRFFASWRLCRDVFFLESKIRTKTELLNLSRARIMETVQFKQENQI